jgi:hypothetical protein
LVGALFALTSPSYIYIYHNIISARATAADGGLRFRFCTHAPVQNGS